MQAAAKAPSSTPIRRRTRFDERAENSDERKKQAKAHL